MTKLLAIGLIAVLSSVSHAFSISQVSSVECDDPAATQQYFTTSHYGAEKYTRRADTIPYSYGNFKAFSTKTGQMKLQNDPDKEGGTIVLLEDDGYDVSMIRLIPTVTAGAYDGFLSGTVEEPGGDIVQISEYPLACAVSFF